MDSLFIRELQVEALIGVYDWERRVEQTLVIDLDLACDARSAAAVDSIQGTVDYHAVAVRVREFVGQSHFHLVETLAERTATLLLQEFGLAWVRVTVRKPGAIPGARAVGITIERKSEAGA